MSTSGMATMCQVTMHAWRPHQGWPQQSAHITVKSNHGSSDEKDEGFFAIVNKALPPALSALITWPGVTVAATACTLPNAHPRSLLVGLDIARPGSFQCCNAKVLHSLA